MTPDLTSYDSLDRAEAEASVLGLVVLVPNGYELFLDLDNGSDISPKTWGVFNKAFPVLSQLATTSKSGNIHLYIRLESEVDDVLRIALQAALGSDPVKEVLSLRSG